MANEENVGDVDMDSDEELEKLRFGFNCSHTTLYWSPFFVLWKPLFWHSCRKEKEDKKAAFDKEYDLGEGGV